MMIPFLLSSILVVLYLLNHDMFLAPIIEFQIQFKNHLKLEELEGRGEMRVWRKTLNVSVIAGERRTKG